MRVLIVDDTPDDRMLVRHELLAAFPEAEAVEVGDRAGFEGMLRGPQPELVITDLQLRWGSGREVFERVRATFPETPVVMFTGSGDETTAVELMKAGLDDYVVKSPRQLARLRTSLRIVVDSARHRTRLGERDAELAAALARQKVIVRELHHRVKNNLQTMTSMLRLRAREVGGEVAAHLEEIAGRMQALAVVQSKIYETEHLDLVDFNAALSEIAETLVATRADSKIALELRQRGQLRLEVARAVPLGLLCYEAILNALKHAWPEGRQARLEVTLDAEGGEGAIVIADDGVGFEENSVTKGLGSRISRALAQEARVELDVAAGKGSGTTVRIGVKRG